MTEANATGEPDDAVEAPETAVDETIAPAPVDAEAIAQQAAEAREAAEAATTRGDQLFEALKLRTLEAAAGDLLRATSDLPADDDRYYDANGFPSLEGMRAVAEELIAAKPYLARPRGDVRQGVRDEPAAPTWSDVLRGALS